MLILLAVYNSGQVIFEGATSSGSADPAVAL